MGMHTKRGTAALPAYSFNDRTNIGVDSLAASQLDLIVGGVSQVQIGLSGAVALTNLTATQTREITNVLGGAAAAGATTEYSAVVLKTGLTDTTATDVITVTVPNAQHAFVIELQVAGIMGAGGAVGAGETIKNASYQIVGVRTSGLACVVTVSSAVSTNQAKVAGADNITSTVVTCSAMTGANSASQTFTIKVAVTKAAGAADNHVALVRARLLNQNATGVSLAAA